MIALNVETETISELTNFCQYSTHEPEENTVDNSK
jgi:hypothetical protein